MKVKVTLNGKTADIDIPDEKLEELGLKEKKKPTGYERGGSHSIYYSSTSSRADGRVIVDNDINSAIDRAKYSHANYYRDRILAESNARADTLMRKLRRFAAENGGIPSVEDWKDNEAPKYYISAFYADHRGIHPECSWIRASRDAFQIYFKSKEACERAIEEFKDELTWYFAEYQAMLY